MAIYFVSFELKVLQVLEVVKNVVRFAWFGAIMFNNKWT